MSKTSADEKSEAAALAASREPRATRVTNVSNLVSLGSARLNTHQQSNRHHDLQNPPLHTQNCCFHHHSWCSSASYPALAAAPDHCLACTATPPASRTTVRRLGTVGVGCEARRARCRVGRARASRKGKETSWSRTCFEQGRKTSL